MVDTKIYMYLYVVWMLCINPLTPKIWLFILPFGYQHISLYISNDNLVIDLVMWRNSKHPGLTLRFDPCYQLFMFLHSLYFNAFTTLLHCQYVY